MENIAIIPARSGSKGLIDKNVRRFNGKPLLACTVEAALKSGKFACVHVSTDSEIYAKIAKEYGADIPFLRAPELSSDNSDSWDAVRYVINEYSKRGRVFKSVALLQPTSPLRDTNDILNAYKIFEEKSADSVISVCETEHSPMICNTLSDDNRMENFIDEEKCGNRQELPTYYRINGAIYIQRVNLLMKREKLYNVNSFAYIMDKRKSIDIDDEYDFMLAEVLDNYQRSKQ